MVRSVRIDRWAGRIYQCCRLRRHHPCHRAARRRSDRRRLANGARSRRRRSRRRRCEHARGEHLLLRPRRDNCQHAISALGAITGRVGFAWDRSLAYAKGGGAWTDTSYSLSGNTSALTLGTGGTTLDRWGWTAGGGIEYALTNHWTALAEYDHVGVPSATVPFPSVAVINTHTIGVKQSVNLFKLGVNYKFELADLSAIAATN